MWIAVITVVVILAIVGLCGVLRSRHRRDMAALSNAADPTGSDGTTT